MKVSIVTSTFNCASEIAVNIENVRQLKQSELPCQIEWVVADGESEDGTIQKLEECGDTVDVLISEMDTGIYNAWNKAIKRVSGDWVIFMGAGDRLLVQGLRALLSDLNNVDYHLYPLVYGNVDLVDKSGKYLTSYKRIDESDYSCGRQPQPCHQGVFQHISLFSEALPFDETYKIAADSKFLLTIMSEKWPYYIDSTVAEMQMWGVSTDPRHLRKVMKELDRLNTELGFSMPILAKSKFVIKSYIKIAVVNLLGYRVLGSLSSLYKYVVGKDNLY